MKNDEPTLDLPDTTLVERIDKATLVPMYDTNHEHVYVRDPEDETDDYVAEMCSVKDCNVGRLIAKT